MKEIVKTINNTKYVFKITYRSLSLIGDDFEIPEGEDFNKYPLKIFKTVGTLMYGALNWANDVHFTRDESVEILESFLNEGGDLITFCDELFNLLQDSVFFKGLLANQEAENNVKQKAKKRA